MYARAIAFAAVALSLTAGCAHRPAHDTAAEGERLQLRQAGFLAALSARDAERTAAYFSDNAVVHVANMPPLQGRSAIREFYGNVFRFLSESESVPEMIQVSSGADMAYSVGRVANVFEGDQGQVEYSGKYLLVWEQREGEWWISAYSISNNRRDANR